MKKQELEYWPLDKFIEYARNPRNHNVNNAVDKIAAAIHEFGFRVPMLAKSDGLIVDGHLRLKAARKLGLESVPVMLADDMSDVQIKAFRLSVNKMAELAEWDDVLLTLELMELGDRGFDLELTGFNLDEIEESLSEKIKQKIETIKPIRWTRILISIPSSVAVSGIDEFLSGIVEKGGEVDYGGN